MIKQLWLASLASIFLTSASMAAVQPRIVGGLESSPLQWGFMAALAFRNDGETATLSLRQNNREFDTHPIAGTPAHPFSGVLVDCGLAESRCENVSGEVCLIQRGNITFAEKIRNCAAGGGIAAIIFNNEPGGFSGRVDGNGSPIPALGVNQQDGADLMGALGEEVSGSIRFVTGLNSFCGGSLIGPSWVVTAAHCVEDIDPARIVVSLGGHRMSGSGNEVIPVKHFLIHRDFSRITLRNDIALIQLEKPAAATPVRITNAATLETEIDSGAKALILGRGTQTPVPAGELPQGGATDKLYQVELPLIANDVCNDQLNRINPYLPDPVSVNMLCAGARTGGKDACFGDSGGPLLVKIDGEYQLAGLTSWAYGCAGADSPSVYTRIPSYLGAIAGVTTGKSLFFEDIAADKTVPPAGEGSGNTPPSPEAGGSTDPVINIDDDVPAPAVTADRHGGGAENFFWLAAMVLLGVFRPGRGLLHQFFLDPEKIFPKTFFHQLRYPGQERNHSLSTHRLPEE